MPFDKCPFFAMIFKLHILRMVVFSLSCLLAIAVLALAGQFIWTTQKGPVVNGAALAIASAVITVLTLPVLLIIDVIRTDAFTSMVVVELACLFVLWVHWLAAAIDSTQFSGSFCSTSTLDDCNPALMFNVEALSYTIWLMLLSYSIVILTMAIIGAARGRKTWTSSVKYGSFLGTKDQVIPPVGVQPGVQLPQSASPMSPVLEYPMLPEPHDDRSSPDQNAQGSHHAVVYV